MSAAVKDEQIELLIRKLQEMGEIERRSVRRTQDSFLDWLKKLGLESLAIKLAHSGLWDKVWCALTNVFDMISAGISSALDWLAECLGLGS
jgi:hypothetical protein